MGHATMQTEVRAKKKRESVTSSSRSSLVYLGQLETHSAGGLRKHEDGGRLHSKAWASGLQLPRESESEHRGAESWPHRSGGAGNKRGEEKGEGDEEEEGRKKKRRMVVVWH